MKKTTLGELIANAVSHGVGILLGITALVLLIVKASTTREVIASLIFGIALVILYTSSTLFHSFPDKMKRTRTVFQRLDHASIFILITGTYTPFLLLAGANTKSYILLAILWTLTIVGIVMKSIWIQKYQAVHLVIYLLMGWSVMLIFNDIFGDIQNIFMLVLLGGLSYTVGVIFYISKFKYNHFIWHIFVLLGSIFHFASVYFGLL